MRNAAIALLLLLAMGATGQNRSDFNKYLVPLETSDVFGAHGSHWRTEWWLHNAGTRPAGMLWGPGPCQGPPPCLSQDLPPRTTRRELLFARVPGDPGQGGFVYVRKTDDPMMSMSLRVRDLSKNAQSYGTEIPIVFEGDFAPAMFLIDIPTDPKYRARLRVYGPDETTIPVQVTVLADGTEVETYTVQLEGVVFIQEPEFPVYPAYAELDPLTPTVRASGERVHVVVESANAPIWAFVSVTNNETQQITTVTSN